jgi:hypothetical protein
LIGRDSKPLGRAGNQRRAIGLDEGAVRRRCDVCECGVEREWVAGRPDASDELTCEVDLVRVAGREIVEDALDPCDVMCAVVACDER